MKSAQSFMTLAMFGLLISLPVYVAYVFVERFKEDKRVVILALSTAGATGTGTLKTYLSDRVGEIS